MGTAYCRGTIEEGESTDVFAWVACGLLVCSGVLLLESFLCRVSICGNGDGTEVGGGGVESSGSSTVSVSSGTRTTLCFFLFLFLEAFFAGYTEYTKNSSPFSNQVLV